MKRHRIIILGFALWALGMLAASCSSPDPAISKVDGMYVVDTSLIEDNDIQGFKGPTPILVYIKDGSVVKVERKGEWKEGQRHIDRVFEGIGHSWDGKSLSEAGDSEVDAVSGSTFTSKGLIENVNLALEYYMSKKKGRK